MTDPILKYNPEFFGEPSPSNFGSSVQTQPLQNSMFQMGNTAPLLDGFGSGVQHQLGVFNSYLPQSLQVGGLPNSSNGFNQNLNFDSSLLNANPNVGQPLQNTGMSTMDMLQTGVGVGQAALNWFMGNRQISVAEDNLALKEQAYADTRADARRLDDMFESYGKGERYA